MVFVICLDGDEGKDLVGLVSLYGKIRQTICALPEDKKSRVTVMIDDISLMEVAANGAMNYVLDFLHYCHALTSEFVRDGFSILLFMFMVVTYCCSLGNFLLQGCSLVTLNHEDIYSEIPMLKLQMGYLADVLIKAEPLATGLAADVHGQVLSFLFT